MGTGTCVASRTCMRIIGSFCILLNKSHTYGHMYQITVTLSFDSQAYRHQRYVNSDFRAIILGTFESET